MRGKLDLTGHKLAGLYRAPAQRSWHRRTRMQKRPDDIYHICWRLIDGAVRDTFTKHPEYLTDSGRQSATNSIVKRATGAIYGYCTQVRESRSVTDQESLSPYAAADSTVALHRRGAWMRLFKAFASWVRATVTRTRGGDSHVTAQNITLLKWVSSEEEAAEMQRNGWVCDPTQTLTRHHKYSILLKKVSRDG